MTSLLMKGIRDNIAASLEQVEILMSDDIVYEICGDELKDIKKTILDAGVELMEAEKSLKEARDSINKLQ